MRTKGRYRKVVRAVPDFPEVQRPGYSGYCNWTLYLDCGHTVKRRSTVNATWKGSECGEEICRGQKKTVSLPDPKVLFRNTLDALILECKQNLEKEFCFNLAYWDSRQTTLMEIRQLYTETFGG
jgi:hypothetical protein